MSKGAILCLGEVGYAERVREILAEITEHSFYSKPPFLHWKRSAVRPLSFSIFLLCPFRKNVARFFFDMVGKWLIPGRALHIGLSFATEFQCRPLGKGKFAICELLLEVESEEEAQLAIRNFPFLEREILSGVVSHYRAKKILEVKGLDQGDKALYVQEYLGSFVKKFPGRFDYDIFEEMHHFFVTAKPRLKREWSPMQMGQLISTLYQFRKEIEKEVSSGQSRRYVHLRLKRTSISTPLGPRLGLALFIGLNFLKENELFEERHVLSSLASFVPGIVSIPGSFYPFEGSDGKILTFAIEVVKGDGAPFQDDEMQVLQRGLADSFQRRIEQLVPPIFMPRNEEEVMRGVRTLASELRYLRDLPQIIVSFDEQTDTELTFTVILVRVSLEGAPSIRKSLLKGFLSPVSIDKIRIVGHLRRKYPKEASIFRVRLPSDDFRREDYSVDLFAARLELVRQIEEAVGPVRDFNGGMIAKQNESFAQLKEAVGPLGDRHSLLLQNFFHSIFPASLSTTVDPEIQKSLFSLLIDAVNKGEEDRFQLEIIEGRFHMMAKYKERGSKQKIYAQIEPLKIPPNELLQVEIQLFDSFYLGLIYLSPERKNQQLLLDSLSPLDRAGSTCSYSYE